MSDNLSDVSRRLYRAISLAKSDKLSGMAKLRKQANIDIGNRLKLIRRALAHLEERRAFVRLMDFDEKRYEKYELGDHKISTDYMRRICDRWQVTSDYILLGTFKGLEYTVAEKLKAFGRQTEPA